MDAPREAQGTQAKKPASSRRSRWIAALLILGLGAPSVVFIALAVPAAMPFDTQALADEFPAVEDRSGRLAHPGCALRESKRGEHCVAPTVAGVTDVEVTFASRLTDRGRPVLKGTLSIPTTDAGPRPAVVLVHGSGPNSRDELSPGDLIARFDPPFPVFRALSEHLTARGFVVLRYDKRSCSACYDGKHTDFARFQFSDFIADAKDAVAFVAARPEVDPRRIVVMGHSQGGQLAPFIAVGEPRVAAVVMLAGPLDNFRDGALGQLERIAVIREGQWDHLGAWSVRWLNKRPLQACFDALDGDYDPKAYCIGGGVTQDALARYIALGDKTAATLREVRRPIFVIQGSLDRNIDPTDLTDLQRELSGHDAEFHYVRGMNHALTNTLTPTDPPSLDPSFLDRLDTFLDSVKAPAR